MAVAFAELERDFIRSRTREALAVRKEQGVVLGRPRSTPDDVVARVVREPMEGRTPTPSRATSIATPCRRRKPGARGRGSGAGWQLALDVRQDHIPDEARFTMPKDSHDHARMHI
jgi:hypothetical protein